MHVNLMLQVAEAIWRACVDESIVEWRGPRVAMHAGNGGVPMQKSLVVAIGLIGCGVSERGGDVVTVRAPLAPDAMLAYRDGDGPWMTSTGAATPFTFDAPSGMYSIAFVCPVSPAPGDIYQMTTYELPTLEYPHECKASSVRLSGTIQGMTRSSGDLQWGEQAGYLTLDVPYYELDVATGKHDLLATDGNLVPAHIVIVRDVEVTGATTVDVDFAGPSSIALAPHMFPDQGNRGFIYTTYVSAGGTAISLGPSSGLATVVPAAAMAPGDRQLFYWQTKGLGREHPWSSTTHIGREPPTTFADVAPTSERPAVSMIRTDVSVGLSATWTPQSGAALYWIRSSGWNARVSPAVFEATGKLDLPDVASVPGWGTFAIPPSNMVPWTIYAVTNTDLDEALRPWPTREGDIITTGWVGDAL